MKTWRKEQENPVISLRCTFQVESQRNLLWPNPKINKKTFLLCDIKCDLVKGAKEQISASEQVSVLSLCLWKKEKN